MNFDVDARTIYYCRHGSHAYGLNIPTSDEDYKGICVKPRAAYLGFLHHFEQHEHMGSKSDGVDSVIYSLDKFFKLATDCNPNIIEILNVSENDVLKIDSFGEELLSIREKFLSKKAKFTFTGYAVSQIKRIETHRHWLLHPPSAPPSRAQFGLSETSKISKSEIGAYDSLVNSGKETELTPAIMVLFGKEKEYQLAKTHWDNYLSWKKTRNPARAALEAQYGYDTKHGMHLIRLLRMCVEILQDKKVYVNRRERGDRDELLAIRHGQLSYESLVEEARRLEDLCNKLYSTSTLQNEPDRKFLDATLVNVTDKYLSLYG